MRHGAPYTMKVGKIWRVVVPIRGRLSPKVCKSDFDDKGQADAWLLSDEGQAEITAMRARPEKASARPRLSGLAEPLRA